MPDSPKPPPSNYNHHWHQFKTQIVRVGMLFGQLAYIALRRIGAYLNQHLRQYLSFARKLFKRSPTLAISCFILLLIWIIITLFNLILPGSFIFEGNITAQSLSFTHTGSKDKLFFDTVPRLKTFGMRGSQPETLVLEGTFSSPLNPALNTQLKDLQQLALEFPRPSSHINFESVESANPPDMALIALWLQAQVSVQNFAYQGSSQQVSLCLRGATSSASLCNFAPDAKSQNSSDLVGTGILRLGSQPLKINLSMVDLPQLELESDINHSQETQLEFLPNMDDIEFQVQSPTQLRFTPALPSSSTDSHVSSSLDWIRPDIDVQDVEFIRTNFTNDAQDSLDVSTILAGQVQMGSKTLTLQPRQHLQVFSEHPGIRKLSSIHLSQSPAGLQTLFTGKSRGVAIGLSLDFPIQKIQPRLLSNSLSPEAFNALLVLVAALTGTLFPRLLLPPE